MSDRVKTEKTLARTPRRSRRAPLAAVAVSFALGILWAHSSRTQIDASWLLAGAGVCLLSGLLILRAGWDRTAVAFAFVALIPTGFAAERLYPARFPRNHISRLQSLGVDLSQPVWLEGYVVSTPYRTGEAMQLDLEARRVESHGRAREVTGRIRLRLQGPQQFDASSAERPNELRYGSGIRTLVQLRRPHVYQNPGSFDFRRWMEDIEDIYWAGTIRDARLIEKTGHKKGLSAGEILDRARQRLLRGIDDLYPPWSAQGRYGAVLKAVLWGDRTALDADTIEGFRRTGLYHLLVIAGLHVGLLTMMLGVLLRRFPWSTTTKSGIVLAFLVAYAALVEQRAPTLRATLMIAFYLVARLLDRDSTALNSIGGVAFILLFIRPAWLFESGFQLSFAAALLIVGVAAPILERTTEPWRRALLRLDDVLLDDFLPPRVAQLRLDLRAVVMGLRRKSSFCERHPSLSRNLIVLPFRLLVWTVNILVFSSVLQLGLLLLMVETFHRVTFAGVGLNAVAIPVMTVLLALALPINILSVVSPILAAWPAKLLSVVMALLFSLTRLPAHTPWLSYRIPEPPHWIAWCFCAAFLLAALVLRLVPKLTAAALAVCVVFVLVVAVHPFAPHVPHGMTELTALDCGQGQSLFLVLPDQTTMLVDAGGGRQPPMRGGSLQTHRWNPAEEIVSPFLWSRGLKRIDILVLTDPRADRLGEIGAIFENFRVGAFWLPEGPANWEYSDLLDRFNKRGTAVKILSAGMTVDRGETQIRILWPPNQNALATTTPATDPSVIQILSPHTSVLLSGGASRKIENQLLRQGTLLKSTVLAVEFRTPRSSVGPDYISRVEPRLVVVSGERGNVSESETAASRNLGTRFVHTGSDGATTMEWVGESLTIHSYAHAGEHELGDGGAGDSE